jgi:ATP-dependent helicase YprA (DUF1998 family)
MFVGAIYMHQGNTYLVQELDTEKRMAKVISVNVEWTTRQRDFTYIFQVVLISGTSIQLRHMLFDRSLDRRVTHFMGISAVSSSSLPSDSK